MNLSFGIKNELTIPNQKVKLSDYLAQTPKNIKNEIFKNLNITPGNSNR